MRREGRTFLLDVERGSLSEDLSKLDEVSIRRSLNEVRQHDLRVIQEKRRASVSGCKADGMRVSPALRVGPILAQRSQKIYWEKNKK